MSESLDKLCGCTMITLSVGMLVVFVLWGFVSPLLPASSKLRAVFPRHE
ncbi:hypothetical protein KIPB_015677, partial [Kipferlia bialata]|eukprot:g15677.t1